MATSSRMLLMLRHGPHMNTTARATCSMGTCTGVLSLLHSDAALMQYKSRGL